MREPGFAALAGLPPKAARRNDTGVVTWLTQPAQHTMDRAGIVGCEILIVDDERRDPAVTEERLPAAVVAGEQFLQLEDG